MSELQYKLEIFEGPLDLLLSLIAKNKVDIKDIPISLIFTQYMAYLTEMERMDMEVAGEFIVMASELMLIKSKMLLPKKEDDEDPREKLAEALLAYKQAKEAASYLGGQYERYHNRFIKETEEIKSDKNIVLDQDIRLLELAFQRMLNRRREEEEQSGKKLNPNVDIFRQELQREIIPIPERMVGVMQYLRGRDAVSFDELMYSSRSRSELIATFGALLELLKSGLIKLEESVDEEGQSTVLLTALAADVTEDMTDGNTDY